MAVDAVTAVDRAAGRPAMERPTSGSSQPVEFDTAVAIIVHQPMEPSAREISSMARKTTSGGSSGPPIARGRYICRRPAWASASTTGVGTRRSISHSSRAASTCGIRRLAAATAPACADADAPGGEA